MPTYAKKTGGRRRRFRYRHSTKKLRAAGRAAKSAKYRRSAKSQARQIRTIGRSVVRVQKQLIQDTTAFSTWQSRIQNYALDGDLGEGLVVNRGIFVIPLTSGPSVQAAAAQSSVADPAINDMQWYQVQPNIRDTGSGQTDRNGPTWLKMYTQTCRMCFYQNDMNRGNRFDMYVVRLARDGETQSDNTMLSRLTTLDGAAFNGHPDSATRFNDGEDFYACQGFLDPTPTDLGGTEGNAYELVRMNRQRYVVEHHRSFSLGRHVGPQTGTAVIATDSAALTQHGRDYYETTFKVNYGGAKLMATDDDAGTNNDPITISDIKYSDIDPKLKRWIVIFPGRNCSTIAGTGTPRFSLITNTTCKVPV